MDSKSARNFTNNVKTIYKNCDKIVEDVFNATGENSNAEDIKEITNIVNNMFKTFSISSKKKKEVSVNDNILSLDIKIQKRLKEEKMNIYIHKKSLKDKIKQFKKENDIRKIKSLQNEIYELNKTIEDIENDKNLITYLTSSQELVNEYLEFLKIPIHINFSKKKNKSTAKKADELWNNFIEVAKKYLTKEEYQQLIKKKLENDDICCKEIDSENSICSKCGKQITRLDLNSTYKDIDRINIIQSVNYERITHFRDAFNQFQGKQNTHISPEVFIKVNDKLNKNELILNNSKTKEEAYKNVKIEHIRMFLGETGNSKQYENCHLIWSLITGRELLNLSHIEDKILEDFIELCKVYDSFDFDRDNFLNAQFVIYQLLNKNGIKVKETDFHMLKTVERRMLYNNMYGKCCEILNWKWIPLS